MARDDKTLLRVAREAIISHLEGREYMPRPVCEELENEGRHGVFVSLWAPGELSPDLRGCIGRFGREFPTLPEDVANCAVSAAVGDPRFAPVRIVEMTAIGIEISLLGPSEEVEDQRYLDPKKWGVIMTSRVTQRQATLLPGIIGIRTIEQQLLAVRRKAGIALGEPVRLVRYPVRKICDWEEE